MDKCISFLYQVFRDHFIVGSSLVIFGTDINPIRSESVLDPNEPGSIIKTVLVILNRLPIDFV